MTHSQMQACSAADKVCVHCVPLIFGAPANTRPNERESDPPTFWPVCEKRCSARSLRRTCSGTSLAVRSSEEPWTWPPLVLSAHRCPTLTPSNNKAKICEKPISPVIAPSGKVTRAFSLPQREQCHLVGGVTRRAVCGRVVKGAVEHSIMKTWNQT